MSELFRLGLSCSSFLYSMPSDLVQAAYVSRLEGYPVLFDESQNKSMAVFMQDMMDAINSSDVKTVEFYHATSWDNKMIVDIIKSNPGVEIWSVHAPYGKYFDTSSPDYECRKSAIYGYLDAVNIASEIGAKLVVAHPGANIKYDCSRETRISHSVDTLYEIANKAGELGIIIAIEPMPKDETGNTLDEVLDIIERINLPNVGINFDVNHLFPASAIPSLIKKAGNRIFSVHISDQDDNERHWLPFKGNLDWARVLEALDYACYDGPLIYETHMKEIKDCKKVTEIVSENYKHLIKLAPNKTHISRLFA